MFEKDLSDQERDFIQFELDAKDVLAQDDVQKALKRYLRDNAKKNRRIMNIKPRNVSPSK